MQAGQDSQTGPAHPGVQQSPDDPKLKQLCSCTQGTHKIHTALHPSRVLLQVFKPSSAQQANDSNPESRCQWTKNKNPLSTVAQHGTNEASGSPALT